MRYIKIWGLKRSGTNYLRWWLENNFKDVKVLMDILGWKHGPPTRDSLAQWETWYPEWSPNEMPVTEDKAQQLADLRDRGEIIDIMIVKDPIAWIDSMRRFDIKRGKISGLTGLVKDWNERVRQYRDFGGTVLRYEMLIGHDKTVQKALAGLLGLKPTGEAVFHSGRFERGNDTMDPEDCVTPRSIDYDYYLSRRYLQNFTEEQMQAILDNLDMELVRDFLHYDQFWAGRTKSCAPSSLPQ